MTETRVVVVLGGDQRDRSSAIADLLLENGGTSLILTGSPETVDGRLDTSDAGSVEVRFDDPAVRMEAYRSGAVDPDDEVLAALSVGSDGPLAAVLGWEYARRAAAAGVWNVVVVELDGSLAGVRRIAATGELAAFVESRWPSHVRFASMAAGDRADARMREAHRLWQLTRDVSEFLADVVEVMVAGSASAEVAAMADLARGALTPEVSEDGRGGFRVEVLVPGPPSVPPTIEGERLRLSFPALTAAVPLPALFARCVLVDSSYDTEAGAVVAEFVPDPQLWPSNLVPAGFQE